MTRSTIGWSVLNYTQNVYTCIGVLFVLVQELSTALSSAKSSFLGKTRIDIRTKRCTPSQSWIKVYFWVKLG